MLILITVHVIGRSYSSNKFYACIVFCTEYHFHIYIYIYKSLLFNFHSVHLTGIRTSVKGHLWAYIRTYVSTYCINVEIHHPGKN